MAYFDNDHFISEAVLELENNLDNTIGEDLMKLQMFISEMKYFSSTHNESRVSGLPTA
jgi:hypothetical protein